MKKARKVQKGQIVLIARTREGLVGRALSYNKRRELTLEWPLLGQFPPGCVRVPKSIKDAVIFRSIRPEQIRPYATKRGALAGLKKIAREEDLDRVMEAYR